ncbi:hypothetical protein NP493_289g01052 [Ridgeia piscesae]|uniref:Uncharacterized protein n=1 Tax=Ridgeia piscesae TaxID=27915 RepID=A0AAD9NWJ3_RIDPI|nr:hypothetical protein NP493_289g01052 [Ridgeia piscesae]
MVLLPCAVLAQWSAVLAQWSAVLVLSGGAYIEVTDRRLELEEEVMEDHTYCEVCGQGNREDRLLLCDGCDLG